MDSQLCFLAASRRADSVLVRRMHSANERDLRSRRFSLATGRIRCLSRAFVAHNERQAGSRSERHGGRCPSQCVVQDSGRVADATPRRATGAIDVGARQRERSRRDTCVACNSSPRTAPIQQSNVVVTLRREIYGIEEADDLVRFGVVAAPSQGRPVQQLDTNSLSPAVDRAALGDEREIVMRCRAKWAGRC
jgi:hypothetical protein